MFIYKLFQGTRGRRGRRGLKGDRGEPVFTLLLIFIFSFSQIDVVYLYFLVIQCCSSLWSSRTEQVIVEKLLEIPIYESFLEIPIYETFLHNKMQNKCKCVHRNIL